ncbi:GNAT family N-acetyltransferase [Nissabacter sp. SGAir0207]|uniref:GNAT family N-acetyltransferase n=1 Tax=Nissabacter sp. SGAir0207 TaxID=2126321 RepID=UPI0010CCFD24|nr:GNAT family N-acetyltransferase [Nissabacter sp. SGAir0207]QCR38470.1 GNAT family N-acetyltransferase [Nissabacter sp. SGAir0207]
MESSVPVITTDRLILRGHTLEDMPALTRLWGDAQVTRYIGGAPSGREESWSRLLRHAGHWQLLGFGYWAVESRESGEYLGCIGFADYQRSLETDVSNMAEMGWTFLPAFHGKGYATEAVAAALAWAASNLTRPIWCMINPDNTASHRLALKMGFEQQGYDRYHDKPVVLYRHRPA